MNLQNPTGFTAGTTGAAGDAGKMSSTGFNLTPMSSMPKPGSLFGSSLAGGTAPTFGTASATGTTLGAPSGAPGTGLTFGPTSTPGAGLNFGTSGGTSGGGLSFGTTAATPANGLNFGMSSGTATITGFGGTGFSGGGLTSAAPTSTSSGLSFGVPEPAATSATSVLSIGSTSSTVTSMPTPQLCFGTDGPRPPNTGFFLGTTTAAPATSAVATAPGTGFGLTTPAATTAQTSAIGTLAAPTSTSGFSLLPSSGAQSLSSGFGIGQTPAATSATAVSTVFSSGPAIATLASGFNLGSGATPSLSSGFSLNKTTTAQPVAATAASNVAPQTSLGTATTVSSASSGQTGTMNFCQLEESINKWTLELEEQEKAFVNQATQVNTWDKLLIANGEKITTLNQEVERVKLEQQHLEHELDYVVGQQKELQDCLVPLEKELASLSVADPERDYTYRLAENLDKQLKQMSQDLKEIIEHLNEANRSQDSSDPIVQIGKILNAHMNSLQWLDQRTCVLEQKIQQIEQMHQNFRQENERSFNLAYN